LPAGSLEAKASRLPAGNIVGALYHKLEGRSSVPEDGRNYRPQHVEMIGIINKPLLFASSWLLILFVLFAFLCNHTGLSLSSGSFVIIRRKFNIFAEVINIPSVLYLA
jgi:hypothetical protein